MNVTTVTIKHSVTTNVLYLVGWSTGKWLRFLLAVTCRCCSFFLLELFENRIFVRGPSHFHLAFSVRKPNCSNSETFENRGLNCNIKRAKMELPDALLRNKGRLQIQTFFKVVNRITSQFPKDSVSIYKDLII